MEPLGEEVLGDPDDPRPPVGPLAGDVLGELRLQLVELEIEVLRRAELGGGPVERAAGVAELARLERPAAVIAFVAPRLLEPAVRARPLEVPVREEPPVGRTVRRVGRPTADVPRLEEGEEHLVDLPLVEDRVGRREHVERDAEPRQRGRVDRVEPGGELGRGGARLLRRDQDRCPVHVRPGDHQHLVVAEPVEPGEDVGGDVRAREVPEMLGSVGVRPRHPDEHPPHRPSHLVEPGPD